MTESPPPNSAELAPLPRRDFFLRAATLLASSELLASCARLSTTASTPGPASGTKSAGQSALKPTATVSEGPVGSRFLRRIGLQLYTVRDLMAKDSEGTLEAVAGAGYAEVEFAGLHKHTAREMRAWLDKFSLTSPAGHLSIEDIRSNWPQLVDDAHTLGWEWIICPWINQSDRTRDGYRRVADEFNRAGEAAQKAGLRFAYHNHEFDFRAMPDGAIPYDLLLAELDPRLVDLELDLYWIVKGGGDPLKYLTHFPGRIRLLHVKDLSKSGQMVDVGQGAIDFKAIFSIAVPAGTRHFLVEHDDPSNPIADITASFNYLKALRF